MAVRHLRSALSGDKEGARSSFGLPASSDPESVSGSDTFGSKPVSPSVGLFVCRRFADLEGQLNETCVFTRRTQSTSS